MTEATVETAAEVTAPDPSELNDLARLVLQTLEGQVTEYNSRIATIDAATGDKVKAVHELRNNSDDPKVVKFRKWLEDIDAKRETAIKDIEAYISETLVPSVDMAPEKIEAEKESLKALKAEINSGEKYFLGLPAVKALAGAEKLLPEIKGSRKSPAGSGGGTGGPKPRVKAIYLDGELVSHEVVKDGTTTVKSTFTDLRAKLMELHKGVKIETADLHAGYFETAGTKDFTAAPDKVEYGFTVVDKDGKSNHHTILVTK